MSNPPRLLVVGASASETCGVRDHARALEPALRTASAAVDTVWWERDPRWSAAETGRSAAELLGRLEDALSWARPDVVLWHYAVFDYGPRTAWDLRGLPVHAPRLARRLGRGGGTNVALLHECGYRFSEPGWQRKALAVGQRVALVGVMGAADGAILTTERRRAWVGSRRWLPRRPLARIPVCATLGPPPPGRPAPGGSTPRLGVLGFGADDARADVLAGAVAALRERGDPVELVLLGAPGGAGAQADRWRAAAARAGVEAALRFTGVLSERELARRLAEVDIVAFPHGEGVGGGKTTLGSALAFGKPVVALRGAETWLDAAREHALVISEPEPAALAGRLGELLRDPDARRRQGEAGRRFFHREMDPEVAAARVLAFAAELRAAPR